MKLRFILAAAAIVPVPVLAQTAEGDQKSPEQIGCELTDGCELADSEGRPVPPTRSWSIGRPTPATGNSMSIRPRQTYTASAAQPAKRASRPAVPSPGIQRGLESARRSSLAINFAVNSAELTEQGRRQADSLLKAIASPQLADRYFLVAGHTDASGNAEDNLNLSRMRAQSLVEYMIGKGASRDRFRARGYGEEQLLAGVNPNSAANRRVEIVKLD